MKFFSFSEILNSLFGSIVFGLICGCLYKASACILRCVVKLFCFPKDYLLLSKSFTINNSKQLSFKMPELTSSPIYVNIFDFLLFLTFGTGLILFNYIFADGTFRLYILVLVVFSFYVSNKTVGKYFDSFFAFLFSFSYFIFLTIVCILLYPFYRLTVIILGKISTFIVFIRRNILKKHSIILAKRKKLQIMSIIRSINFLTKRI